MDREVLAVVLEALEDAIEECAYAEEISGALDRKLERAYALLKEEMGHEQ